MLTDLPRRLSMSLILVAGTSVALYPVLDTSQAWAQDDDEEDDEDDEDEDDEGGDEDEEEGEEDEGQPVVTAGGLYTIKTYPQGEIQRPLTLTKGLIEARAGVGFDISNETAFDTFGAEAGVRYGLQDHMELQAGFKGISNFDVIQAYAAFEGAIVYDLIDFRAGLQLDKVPGSTNFGLTLGFPFRYAPKPEVAVVALETAFEIQFDSEPDATPNIGIVVQPAPIFAVVVKAGLRVPDFNFATENIAIPASVDLQLSPSNRLDVGMQFSFPNLKPADPDGDGAAEAPAFYDSRFLLFFAQYRLGDYKP